MTVAELSNDIRGRLAPSQGSREAVWMVRMIWEALKGWSTVDVAVNGLREVSDYIREKFDDASRRIIAGEPVHYILGCAHFYGMTFRVTPATLIPRPETAELVDMVVDRYRTTADLRVLDAGTGSGCIAVALARNLPFCRVTAIDISPAAIEVARQNAIDLKARVDFQVADMLRLPATDVGSYDIVVSNPPYIAMHERQEMSATVADHEPPQALFVPDDDPLRFYNALCDYASHALVSGGAIFFELNPDYAQALVGRMRDAGVWDDIQLRRDMQRRERFLSATKR